MKRSLVVTLALVGAVVGKAGIPKDVEMKKIVYKKVPGGEPLTLSVFTAKDKPKNKKLPAIVFFFGGGWKGGSPGQFYGQCAHLAQKGMVAISAQYRTEKSHKVTPDKCIEDGKSAMRYVKAHADELGIDPNKLLAGGGSAGGHVAAATAFVEKFNAKDDDLKVDCRPVALVLFNPVVDNSEKGYGYKRVKEYWKDFSPMHNVKDNSPVVLFMVGDKDGLIPVATAEKFKEIIESKGGKCELKIYKGATHGFFNKSRFDGKFYKETVKDMDKFLTDLGYISG
jgi:acetyl esterase/lipase